MNAHTRNATYARYHEQPAHVEADDAAHWITRAANFVVVTSKVEDGTVLERIGQFDEYMVLLPEGVGATFTATRTDGALDTVVSPGDTLTIVPPGDSRIDIAGAGYVYRVFSHKAEDLTALAENAGDYGQSVSDVAALEPWPTPPDGFRLRQYALGDYVRDGTNMRLFRSTNMMINIFVTQTRPRDVTKMTPHHHDDFEQGSLALMGRYVHHFRYPWMSDMTQWREDDHGEVGSPSIVIIPPNVIHTTQAIGGDPTRLVDIFAPPRVDFSLKPGLVNNAAEYPMPSAPAPQAG